MYKRSVFYYTKYIYLVHRPLNKAYLEVVRSVFMSSTSASGTGRKRTIKDLQEEVSNLYNNIRLFEKGVKFFTGILNTIFSLIFIVVLGHSF